MLVNVNNQVFNTLASSMNINGFNYTTSALGFTASVELRGQTNIQVINNSISINCSPKIYWGWFFGYEADI